MKKYITIILLLPLLIVAFANAGIISLQEAAMSSSVTVTPNDCFRVNVNYPAVEIERCNISGNIGFRAQQLFKRVPSFLAGQANSQVTSTLVSSSRLFPGLTTLDNYLSHNYPSHNFW